MRILVLLMMLVLVTTIFPFEYVRYTTADGLANNYVRDVAIADDGTIWIASAFDVSFTGGLTKWDSNGFTSYYTWNTDGGLLCNTVHQVELDTVGNIWVSSGHPISCTGGISRFDGLTWTSFTVEELYGDSLAGGIYKLAFDHTGNLLLVSGGGSDFGGPLCKFNITTHEFSIIHGYADEPVDFYRIVDVLVASDSSVWLPNRRDGLLHIVDSTKTLYTVDDGLISNYCNSVDEDSSRNLWVGFSRVYHSGVNYGRVMYFDGIEWINPFHGVVSDTAFRCPSIKIDEYNRKWIGDRNKMFCISDTGYVQLNYEHVSYLAPFALADNKLYAGAVAVSPGLYVTDVSTIDWDWTPLPPYSVEEPDDLPKEFDIDVYPNPFNSSCNLSSNEQSQFTIYDIQGKKIETLEGREVSWKPQDGLGSGVYIVNADNRRGSVPKRLIHIK